MAVAYKRVLIKISGEALAAEKKTGYDFSFASAVCESVKRCVEMGAEVGIVVGGGNFWRGVKDGGGRMERTRADHMGMMATVMNALAVSDVFEQMGVPVRVQTAITMSQIAEPYIRLKADKHLRTGRVVILLAKNIDGVYSADPRTDPSAVKYDHISYDEVLAKHLAVMDTTATSLSMDNHIPIIVFALADPQNIVRVVCGEDVGTKVN